MTEKAQAELIEDVLSRYEGSPNPRAREICEAAIRHLHAFVSEVNLTRDEWFYGIQFLTRAGQMCDETRQEFIASNLPRHPELRDWVYDELRNAQAESPSKPA